MDLSGAGMPKMAVALSWGGYQASLFGLGTLLYYPVEARKNTEGSYISSVSGRSFTDR